MESVQLRENDRLCRRAGSERQVWCAYWVFNNAMTLDSQSCPHTPECEGRWNTWSTVTKREAQNYSTRDSRMVTHCSTNLAMLCLDMAERTGSLVFITL
ncbi:hypothetical protein K440DRAFT_405125 [Wilcoxina mikolae CBS 423.85]|nr:hypothetical protein K440DRAFT_405125 [Wilcoxina mikolae CBS 423.85]